MSNSSPVSTTRTADALIVGGGPSGLAAASALARAGRRVLLAEKNFALGGKTASFPCMATSRCQRCGACLVEDEIASVLSQPGVTILRGANVASVSRAGTSFTVKLEPSTAEHVLPENPAHGSRLQDDGAWSVDAVLLCTGYDVFDASLKPFLGYGKHAGVTTTLELDALLARSGDEGWCVDGKAPGRVAFVQCVGSRESREGRGYCSQVCCSVALRLAGKLLHLHPETEVTIYYIDLQLASRNIRNLYHESREGKRIRFLQGVPGEIVAGSEGELVVHHEADEENGPTATPYDRVVLSVGMVPTASTNELASLFGLEQGEYGFISSDGPPVLAAGACTFPTDIPGAMSSGREAASRLLKAMAQEGVRHG